MNSDMIIARLPLIRNVLLIVATAILAATALAQRPLGIDVSHWQGPSIDWTNVKNSGIMFAWTKASEGDGLADGTFVINETKGKAAGVLMGAYHFARYDLNNGTTGAINEANYFWTVARNYIAGDGSYLMPMLDS